MHRIVKHLYTSDKKKKWVSIPDNERKVLNHLARETLVNGRCVTGTEKVGGTRTHKFIKAKCGIEEV